jgi:predicted transcriptional regulator
MQVTFTPKQEAELSQIASHNGTDPEELVKEAVLRLIDDLKFREGVKRGIAAAERGDFVDSAELWSSIESILPA